MKLNRYKDAARGWRHVTASPQGGWYRPKTDKKERKT